MLQIQSGLSAVLCVVVASIFWGTTGTASAFIPDVSPLGIGAFAMGVGGILLVLNAKKYLVSDKAKLLSQPKVLLIGSLCVAIYPLAFYSSMRLAGVAIGTVISIASAPFFTVMMERLISNKNITRRWKISFTFGGIGVILLTLGKTHYLDVTVASSNQVLGVLLGLVAGLTYATYSWSAHQMIENGVNAKSAMASMFGLSAILLLPSLLFTGDNLFLDIKHISVALYMAIAPMFLGYLLFGQALKVIEASRATLITLLEPIVATILAIIIIGEAFSSIGWLGMGLMVICLLLQVIKIPKPKVNPENHRLPIS
ncbi:EamA family transporter [Psychrobacter sp. Ps6]|uniref:DMT family transporter n=1 Tax=Psychrobacter sp. Ps6 TaxID=2790960 RepID=UPI001EDDA7F8|nr:EamA family transporter [Psychrobacter sp. Ps6]MCG3879676.1 EamA family transporter [Psychrobacter sp. Ps6]